MPETREEPNEALVVIFEGEQESEAMVVQSLPRVGRHRSPDDQL